MFAFLSQAVTGVFLAMYYRPDATGGAYQSIRYITDQAFLGQFVRGMHKWGASVMVILIFLHMARVFFFGAYKYPRELTWVIGVALLILTMVMGVHRLPAAVRPARLLGDDRRRQHQRHRPVHRSLPVGLLASRARVRGDHALAVLRDPHVADPGAIVALIGAHLYLITKLGHLGAAVAQGRGGAKTSSSRPRSEGERA